MDKTHDKRTYVFIDAANYHYGLKKSGWSMDYDRFKIWLCKNYNIVNLYYYEGIHSRKSYIDSHPHLQDTETKFLRCKEYTNNCFKKLRGFGYKVYTKPISSMYNEPKGEYVLKCNFDVELTMDVLLTADDYDQIILCSGDGDFVRLVKYLKYIGKRVIVIAPNNRISWILKKHCNQLIKLNSLRQNVE